MYTKNEYGSHSQNDRLINKQTREVIYYNPNYHTCFMTDYKTTMKSIQL